LKKEFGIKVHYDVYDSNELMEAKLLAGHPHYDIVANAPVVSSVFAYLDKDPNSESGP
jgi:putrescine transport system substrate-binding protein